MPSPIPDDTALCLYRIAQEALRNVIKHSGARHARVELSGSPDAVSLRIADDGSGFDPGSADGKEGLGLVSMRERLRLVGGESRSTPGRRAGHGSTSASRWCVRRSTGGKTLRIGHRRVS